MTCACLLFQGLVSGILLGISGGSLVHCLSFGVIVCVVWVELSMWHESALLVDFRCFRLFPE